MFNQKYWNDERKIWISRGDYNKDKRDYNKDKRVITI